MSQTANLSLSSTRPSHGQKGVTPTPAGGTADVQVILTTPSTLTRGDFLEACKAAADQFGLK